MTGLSPGGSEEAGRDLRQSVVHWTVHLCGYVLALTLGAFGLSVVAAVAMHELDFVLSGATVVATVVLAGVTAMILSFIAGPFVGFLAWRREQGRLSPTYVAPKDGWVCFHCGERFRKYGTARDHFGPTPESRPGCLIDLGS